MTVASIGLRIESSAAKSFASRRGAGKIRYISVKELWLQRAVNECLVRLSEVGREANPADMLTQSLHIAKLQRLSQLFGLQVGTLPIADAEGACW